MSRTGQIAAVLHDLVDVCDEGERRHRAAAERGPSQLKPIFEEYARQRARFAEELREVAAGFAGGSGDRFEHRAAYPGPPEGGTEAIVSFCGRTEEEVLGAYRKALGTDLPDVIRRVVELQSRDVKEALGRLRSLFEQRRRIVEDERTPGTETEGAPD